MLKGRVAGRSKMRVLRAGFGHLRLMLKILAGRLPTRRVSVSTEAANHRRKWQL
jgi:hypothetical protein